MKIFLPYSEELVFEFLIRCSDSALLTIKIKQFPRASDSVRITGGSFFNAPLKLNGKTNMSPSIFSFPNEKTTSVSGSGFIIM